MGDQSLGLFVVLFFLSVREPGAPSAVPRCGRVTKLYDAVSTRCREELEFPEVAIVSEAAMPRPRVVTPAAKE